MEQRLGEATTSAPVGLVENHTPMGPPTEVPVVGRRKEEETGVNNNVGESVPAVRFAFVARIAFTSRRVYNHMERRV